ncbi:MAG: hypothetical protein ACRD5E_04365 [Nitrososphaeraceae archaeon]
MTPVRTKEIKTHIAENVDKFDIPDWLYGTHGDTTGTFCLIASEVVEQEKIQGTRFEGSDLDDNIGLEILKKQGDIVRKCLRESLNKFLSETILATKIIFVASLIPLVSIVVFRLHSFDART